MSASAAFERSYPADLTDGAGIRFEKMGLRARASLDYSNLLPIDTSFPKGIVAVQDADTGLVGALDLSRLPTSDPADASVTNGKLAPVAPRTLKGNATGSTAAPTDLTAGAVRTLLGAGAASGLATLGTDSKLPPAQLPALDNIAFTIPGARVPTTLAGFFDRTFSFADFGARSMTAAELAAATVPATTDAPSYIDGSLFPSTVLSHTPILNAYLDYCYRNKKTAIFPPGDYLVRGKVIQSPCPIIATGARFYVPNSDASNRDAWLFGHEPELMQNLPVSEMQALTGWDRYSRKLVGLNNRRNQFIIPDVAATIQVLTLRGSNIADAFGFCDPFLVATNDGELAHTLYATATTADRANWIDFSTDPAAVPTENSENTYFAKTLGPEIKIVGLTLIVYEQNDGTGNAEKGALSIRRCRTTLEGCSVFNRSNRRLPAGFGVNKACYVSFVDCLSEGMVGSTYSGTTNYGFLVGGSASVNFTRCKAYHCRRGMDGQRAKNITSTDCEWTNGCGGHWLWWLSVKGGSVGATAIRGGDKLFPENPQAIQVAGGGYHIEDVDIFVSERATAAFRVRTDTYECGDDVVFVNNRVIFDAEVSEYRLLDFRNFDAARRYGRPIDMPRNVVCENNHIIVRRSGKTLTVVFWLRPKVTTWLPDGIDVNSRWSIRKNSILFEDGGPILVTDPDGIARPRIRMYVNKPSNVIKVGGAGATGTGITGVISDLPYLYLELDVDPEAANDGIRFNAHIERIGGQLMIRRAGGAYREILYDAVALDDAPLTSNFDSNASRAGNATVADEWIGPLAKRGVYTGPNNAGFNWGGVRQLSVDAPTNAVNYPVLVGSVTGEAVTVTPGGSDTNVPLRLYGKGTAAATLGRDGAAVGFYGSNGTTKQTLVANASGDLPSVTALANDIKRLLIAVGLSN